MAVTAGNRAGHAAALPERGSVGYQGAGADPLDRFCKEWTAAGGQVHPVPDAIQATGRIEQLVRAMGARRVLLGSSVPAVGLQQRLATLGVEIIEVTSLPPEKQRDAFFTADVGISGADYLIAETGSLALLVRPEEPRSLSLLPPVHIAVARAGQILPDLFDLFARLPELPSCATLITGPSKTGDIELRLVTGVHGPGEVHVILITT
jgi:L-lactate utilization protein LutC